MYDYWRLMIVSIVSEIIALERLHDDNDFLVSFFALQRLRSRRLVWGVGNGRDFIGGCLLCIIVSNQKTSQITLGCVSPVNCDYFKSTKYLSIGFQKPFD